MATAKAGKEDGFWLHGGSAIVAPTGEIVAKATTEEDEVISYDCDMALGEYIRNTTFNFAKHRRPEHYKLITERDRREGRAEQLRNFEMQYAVSDVNHHDRYKILTAFVLPRPIAWVTTLGPTGVVECRAVQLLQRLRRGPAARHVRRQQAAGRTPQGHLARTSSVPASSWSTSPTSRWRAPCTIRAATSRPTSASPTISASKLAPSVDIKPPRLADAPWSMECRTWQVINVKDDRQLVIGEGLRFHIRDELWDPKAMRVHMETLPSGRPHVRRPLLPH